MLRSMCFNNFINFRGFHEITFPKNKPTIFLGANSTGKSSVHELLRRCMTDDINASVSNVFDAKQPAYVFSIFDIPQTRNSETEAVEWVCSGVVNTAENKLSIKVVCWKERGNNSSRLSVCSIRLKKQNSDDNDTPEDGSENYELVDDDENIKAILKKLTKGEELEEQSTKGREILKMVERMYVATLPMRSIGVCQWTRSKALNNKDNYKIAVERADILSTLLDYTDLEIDKKFEEDIFKEIIYPDEFKFEKKNDLIWVTNAKSDNPLPFPLLKCPEGVLEAKQFAMLVSLRNVFILCLEEPDRGMHPQYVERVRNVLKKVCKNKNVLIVTHSPYMINTITAENAFVFYREPSPTQGKNAYGFKSIEKVNRHITDVDELKKMIFASHVLFVEGKTEKIIMEGIYNFWMKSDNGTMRFPSHRQIVELHGKDNEKNIREFLTGKDNEKEKRKFCTETFLNLNYAFLFDRDKYIPLKKGKIDKICVSNAELNTKYKDNKTINDLNESDMNLIIEEIKKKRSFFWKDGELEDAIRNTFVKEDDFCDFFGFMPPDDGMDLSKKQKDNMSDEIKKMERQKLENLIPFLIGDDGQGKGDFKRFISFLEEMNKVQQADKNNRADPGDEELRNFFISERKRIGVEMSGSVEIICDIINSSVGDCDLKNFWEKSVQE